MKRKKTVAVDELNPAKLLQYLQEDASASVFDDTHMAELQRQCCDASRYVHHHRSQFFNMIESVCVGFVKEFLSTADKEPIDDFLTFVIDMDILKYGNELCITLGEYVTIRIPELDRTSIEIAKALLQHGSDVAKTYAEKLWYPELSHQAVHDPSWETLDVLYEMVENLPTIKYSRFDFLDHMDRLQGREDFLKNQSSRIVFWKHEISSLIA